ncbi:MAG: FHA domain-containing protein [Gammaproteobacteria bacterium]|nr:FHA domain-containing protein [Gammaproteobacteria bacterium]
MSRSRPMPIGRTGLVAGVLPLARKGFANTPRLRLSLHHPDSKHALQAEALCIPRLPLVVGAAQPGVVTARADLCLPQEHCRDLAPTHFCLLLLEETPAILDVGSRHGTLVNGRWIGRHRLRSHALLRTGWNAIVVGPGPESGALWLNWEH